MNIKPFKIIISQAPVEGALRAHHKNDLAGRDRRANYSGPELGNMKDLTRKALNLPFEDISFANSADIKVNATELGIHIAGG